MQYVCDSLIVTAPCCDGWNTPVTRQGGVDRPPTEIAPNTDVISEHRAPLHAEREGEKERDGGGRVGEKEREGGEWGRKRERGGEKERGRDRERERWRDRERDKEREGNI